MNQKTVFGDLRTRATAVYRVHTRSSVYIIGIHEVRGRKFVIVRGELGTDREHVVVRDSDPRIGERSLFEVPVSEWVGYELEVATMTSSTIVSVGPESDPEAVAAVAIVAAPPAPHEDRSPWARPDPEAAPARAEVPMADPAFVAPRPPGMPASPRIVPNRAKGTHPALGAGSPTPLAKQVVVGAAAPAAAAVVAEPAYPERHILYAENVAALLRSIARRDRLFEDIRGSQRDRLRKSLDDAVTLLEQIRRRDRK